MGEERELLIVLAANRAKLATQRDIAVAYWGQEVVEKHWETSDWLRGRVRYRLKVANQIEQRRRDGG